MKAIKISVVQNGYVVTEDPAGYHLSGREPLMGYACTPYVFETFASMAAWIDANLEKPAQANKEGAE
jgi:hypothetical protein